MRSLQSVWMFVALVTAFVAVGALVSPAAEADSENGFHWYLDPAILEVIETDVDTDSAKFQEYRDLKSGFRLRSLRLFGADDDGERSAALKLRNAGRDDARYRLDYDVWGKWGLTVDYNKIPHRFGNKGTLLWSNQGNGFWAISDSVQAQLQEELERQFAVDPSAINFDFLDNLIQPHLAAANSIDLVVQRDRTEARLDVGRLGGMALGVEYKHENRNGTRPWGGSFGFGNVTEIPEFIDYDTDSAEVLGEWNGKRSGLRFGYRYSMFENNQSTMVWDNPWRITDSTDDRAYVGPGSSSVNGPVQGFSDLAPDNEASLFYVHGRSKLPGNWWINGDFSYNMMSQDDPLLPYTLNTAIDGIDVFNEGAIFDPTLLSTRPAANVDADVDALSLTASGGTTFFNDFNLLLRYRYYDYDNGSTRVSMPGYVRYHAVWEEIPRITVPYAYSTDSFLGEISWDGLKNSRLALSYKLSNWDRTYREVDSSDEDVIKLSFDSRPTGLISIRAHWETGDRSIDGYVTEAQLESFLGEEEINNQPGLRKYAQAARDYDDYEITALFFASEAWNFSVGLTGRNEDYPEGEFGLRTDDTLRYNFDVSYTPGNGMNFYAFGHRADRESFQRARQSGGTLSTSPDDDWELTLDETNDTWGAGFSSECMKNWFFDVSGNWTKSDGEGDFFTTPAGTPSSAEDIANYEDIELLVLQAKADYSITDNTKVGLWYLYEDYTIDSFILQGIQPYLPASLLLAAENGDYEANVFGLYLKLEF